METIGVVGLGIIGGSMAKAIKKNTNKKIYGFDISGETMNMAVMCGAIDGELNEKTIEECNLIMIAVAPKGLINWVRDNAKFINKNAVLIDLCGVKREICNVIAPIAEKYGFCYVGGHPMAGKEVFGFKNSTEKLFSKASMILTPDKNIDINTLVKLKEFFLKIGFGNLTFSTPEEHDKIIAYTSQLAHVTSSAYVKSPMAKERNGFSAGSFKDMTRVARLDENLWTELFMANADFLVEEIEELISNLNEYLDAIKSGNREELRRLLKEGREIKLKVGGR